MFTLTAESKKLLNDANVTVLLQGAPASGKTQLITWHLTGQPVDGYGETVQEDFKYQETIRGHITAVNYLDTGGDSELAEELPEWVQSANAQLLLLNLEDRSSLDYLISNEYALAAAKNMLGGVIVGNLPSGQESNRVISTQEASALSTTLFGAQYSYVEVNTRTGAVAAAFDTLMESIGNRLLGAPAVKEAAPMPQCSEDAASSLEAAEPRKAPAVVVQTPAQQPQVLATQQKKPAAPPRRSKIANVVWPPVTATAAQVVVEAAPSAPEPVAFFKPARTHLREEEIEAESTREELDALKLKTTKMEAMFQAQLEQQRRMFDEQLKAQERAFSARLEAIEARVHKNEEELKPASLMRRIQELLLRQLQSIGWASSGSPKSQKENQQRKAYSTPTKQVPPPPASPRRSGIRANLFG